MTNILKTARYIKADGTEETITPQNGKKFSLKELQALVGGLIDIVQITDRRTMIVNDEGIINGLPQNDTATKLWLERFPLDKYPMNNLGIICGDVVVGKGVF